MSQLDIGLFDNNLPDDYIDLEEASLILGVSPATLRNWVKIGHIRRITGQKKPVFRKSDIELLHAKLKDGSIDKLKTRANKKHSTTTFIPKEYLLNRNDYQRILSVISYIHTKKIPTSTALFLLSLNRLYQARLVSSDVTNVHSIKNIAYKHSSIQKVMTEWRKDLPEFDLNAYKELLIADLPKNGDVLGGIYQSLLLEGDKAQGGSYYTPDFLVNAITQQLKKDVTSTTS